MPRHPRVHAEGLLYHLIARGNNGQKIFLRESDYQVFIERLRTVQELTRFGGDLGQVFCWQFRRILSTRSLNLASEFILAATPVTRPTHRSV
jgi:hypothetical protein